MKEKKCFCIENAGESKKENDFRSFCKGELEKFDNNDYCLMHSPNPMELKQYLRPCKPLF
ncbi:MAG TPA: hypothetical protein VF604_16010 [Pyrinomonadaceae bacterium]|jgi:hypothetical protein